MREGGREGGREGRREGGREGRGEFRLVILDLSSLLAALSVKGFLHYSQCL